MNKEIVKMLLGGVIGISLFFSVIEVMKFIVVRFY